MINANIFKNSFESYNDVVVGFEDLMEPLEPFFSMNHAGHLNLGTHGTVYSQKTREVEAFLRPLWGLGPYLTQKESPLIKEYLKEIIAATDPENINYWGKTKDFDQLIVEMAALSTFLLLNKDKTWDLLTDNQQKNLHAWLIQINKNEMPSNNWHFFRILVNLAMKKCDMPYSKKIIDEDFTLMDSFYIGNGWYYDGVDTQEDYYVSFALHYYSLLYLHFEPSDEGRNKIIKERAIKFAKTFKYWFDSKGEALPFGRSLTYRFAQVAFFSALVFADVEALPWGEIKGLISRNLKSWVNHDIFTEEGLLSVGYHYENLVFAEGYNGPGSPYWSFKTFILLAVPKNHPYWSAETLPLTIRKRKLSSPESRNFYQYNQSLTHVQMFPAGQFVHYQNHSCAKYSKFVYSSYFGFSVSKSDYWYYEGAFDNTLALSEDEHYFRTKPLDEKFKIMDDRIIHYWKPWKDVSIKTTIVPLDGCHLRIHEIDTQRLLFAYEGGFSIASETGEIPEQKQNNIAEITNSYGTSKVEILKGFLETGIVRTEPNTNLFFPLTVLPFGKAKINIGRSTLISLISGRLPEEAIEDVVVKIENGKVRVSQGKEVAEVEY